jgi:CRISPR-associated protein Csx3
MYQFPAILIAGSPNCGKSVLSFLLTQQLRKMRLAHYLLRAAPDGEGDWFLQGDPDFVRPLRVKHKTGYTSQFVTHMKNAIESRLLPLLVDVGGLPRGEQFGILRACTHAILLYRGPEDRLSWLNTLASLGLPLIAGLRSTLDVPGQIEQASPFLQGSISGLDRQNPRMDVTFGALLDRVAGLCRYDALYLEQAHLRHAPYPPISERQLMTRIDPARAGETPSWQFSDLTQVKDLMTVGVPSALYGRGPVWLAAMIGAFVWPAPMAIYDARYGWIPVPDVCTDAGMSLAIEIVKCGEYDWVEFRIPGGIMEPDAINMPPFEGENGIVLSGKLPKWAFVALARWVTPTRAWVGVNDANLNTAVVVHSNLPYLSPGAIIPKPIPP